MLDTAEKAMLLDEFSAQLRRHFPASVWESLFEGTGRAEFGSTTRTLLCVDCPVEGPLTRDRLLVTLNHVAPRHDGLVDPCADAFAFVSFPHPESALQMAVTVQRLVPHARLRMGIGIGRCRMALCSAEGRDFLLLLGEERARVEALTARAAPGTVQLAPEAYEKLHEAISHDLGSCLVMAEFQDDVVTDVSLTLPPNPAAGLSTFAGLGLT
jgi:hypothetical protein